MRPRYWIFLLFAALGWGAGGVFTRAAFAEGVEPVEFSVYRPAFAAALVALYILSATGLRMPRGRSVWRHGFVLGAVNLAAPFLLLTFAVVYASAGFVGLLVANIPIGTALWSHFLGDERLNTPKVVGLSVAFGGILLMLIAGDSGIDEGGNAALAVGLTLAGLSAASFGILYAKRVLIGIQPTALALPQFAVGALLLATILPFTDGVPDGITAHGWILMFAAGLLSTALPFVLMYRAMEQVTAVQASLTGYLIPVFAVALGAIWLDERISPSIIGGGALIFAGIVLVDRATNPTSPTTE